MLPVCLDMGFVALPKEVPEAARPTMGAFSHVTNMWRDRRAEDLKEWDEALMRTVHHAMFLPTNFVGNPAIFVTRSGTRGLMQVTSLTDNPRSVTLRYKLLRPVDTVRGSGPSREEKTLRGLSGNTVIPTDPRDPTWVEVVNERQIRSMASVQTRAG